MPFARVPVAGAVGDVGDERVGGVDGRRRFQQRVRVEERHDAGVACGLGGNDVARPALLVGGARDDGQVISLARRQSGDGGGGHISDLD